jgi:hypothetical protein
MSWGSILAVYGRKKAYNLIIRNNLCHILDVRNMPMKQTALSKMFLILSYSNGRVWKHLSDPVPVHKIAV